MFESLVVQVQQSAFVGLDLDRVEHRVTTTIAVADESHIVTFLDFKGEFDVLHALFEYTFTKPIRLAAGVQSPRQTR